MLSMKTSATCSSCDMPRGLHGNHMQLKPCNLFAKQGRPPMVQHTNACPPVWHSDHGYLCRSEPLFPAPPRCSAGSWLCLPLPRRMQVTLPSAQRWGGRLAGPSPAGPSPGPRPEVGPGPPAQSSPRVSPSAPERSPSGHTPRGRDTRDGHPLPAPVVTYVGGR